MAWLSRKGKQPSFSVPEVSDLGAGVQLPAQTAEPHCLPSFAPVEWGRITLQSRSVEYLKSELKTNYQGEKSR